MPMEAYEILQTARDTARPSGKQFIRKLCTDFIELRGDRRFGDDHAIIGGIGRLAGMPVTVIAQERGEDLNDRARRNFGSPHPEGYRKALRLMKQAEKFRRPVLCLVDTSGAYSGIAAEERGQGQAIAENLMEMMVLKVPIITVVLGEGGSGGALALAVANQVWMLENAFYSVISPEGCASILWKDPARAAEAAECLKLTAEDLTDLSVAEQIISEHEGNFEKTFAFLKEAIGSFIAEKQQIPVEELLRERYDKFRKIQ